MYVKILEQIKVGEFVNRIKNKIRKRLVFALQRWNDEKSNFLVRQNLDKNSRMTERLKPYLFLKSYTILTMEKTFCEYVLSEVTTNSHLQCNQPARVGRVDNCASIFMAKAWDENLPTRKLFSKIHNKFLDPCPPIPMLKMHFKKVSKNVLQSG